MIEKLDQDLLLSSEELMAAEEKAQEMLPDGAGNQEYIAASLWEVAKAQLAKVQSYYKPLLEQKDAKVGYWCEKHYNDTMSAKKSGYDDAKLEFDSKLKDMEKMYFQLLQEAGQKAREELIKQFEADWLNDIQRNSPQWQAIKEKK